MLDSPLGGNIFYLAWLPHSLKKFCAYIKLPIELLSKWEGGRGVTWLDCVIIAGWPETKSLCFIIRESVVLIAGDYGTQFEWYQ